MARSQLSMAISSPFHLSTQGDCASLISQSWAWPLTCISWWTLSRNFQVEDLNVALTLHFSFSLSWWVWKQVLIWRYNPDSWRREQLLWEDIDELEINRYCLSLWDFRVFYYSRITKPTLTITTCYIPTS